jgi:uncharacterized membrane protein
MEHMNLAVIGPKMGYMNRLVLFVAFVVVPTLFALSNIEQLPERIATHFAANGVADGWTSRQDYRVFVVLFLTGLPSLLVWLMAGLPRLTNGKGQIPNREYWFAEERRQATEGFLITHACWLGCMTVAIVYGVHMLIMRANAITPPLMTMDRFITIVVLYLCGLVWWLIAFLRHFQRMDKQN